MIVEENGKTYHINDETGIVTEAHLREPEPVKAGDRVSAEGHLGRVILVSDSIYGDVVAVRHDNGQVLEYPLNVVSHAEEDPTSYDSPVEEYLAEFSNYLESPGITLEEVDDKLVSARQLKLRGQALARTKVSSHELMNLDRAIATLGADLLDLQDTQALLRESKMDLNRFSRYQIGEQIGGMRGHLGGHSDSSWLDDVEDVEVSDATDADLAARATEVAASFNDAQLSNEEFIRTAAQYQESYLGLTDPARKAKFASYLDAARKDRLSEVKEVKEASTEPDIQDFDTTALFI